MTRVGIVGIENSHVDHFVRFLNAERRYPGSTVVAIVRGEPERTAAVREAAGQAAVVAAPSDLVGRVDAAIVCSRDGARHRRDTEPLLAAGLPVLVDKPLAASVPDAEAMLDLAARHRAPLLSASAVRHAPEVAQLADATRDDGERQVVAVTGPADPDSEYSGLFFYGIHVVETALELTGDGQFTPPRVQRSRHTIVATTMINNVLTTLTFVRPDAAGRVPFHALVAGRRGMHSSTLTLGPDYNAPLLDAFMAAVSCGAQPVPAETLLRPVRLLTAIMHADV